MPRTRKLDEIDYYELLGVDRDASADLIKQAFHAFARSYHPDQHQGRPDVVAKSSRIYRRGTEAYRVLSNAEARRHYDQGLARGELRFDISQQRASTRTTMPPTQAGVRNRRARPFVAKAEQAIKAENYAMAKLNLQIALQHDPGNPQLEEKLREVIARLS
jgi:DnaJ-class molecular chaperone